MKKLILIILFLSHCSTAISQYSIIFTDPEARDLGGLISFRNNHNENTAVYIYLAGNWFTFRSPYWVRYYRNNNSFDSLPHNGYLRGGFCVSTWGWGTTGIGKFMIPGTDTNLLLGLYSEGPCSSPEGSIYNLISFNSGQSSFNPLATQNGVMQHFDIDPTNDSVIYGAGSSLYMPTKFWKSTNKGNTWIGINIGSSSRALGVKVNPLAVNEIYCLKMDSLHKSTNFGNSFRAISANPGGEGIMYVDNVDGSLYLASFNGLHRSADGGYIFSLMNSYACRVLLIDPDDHNTLYLGVYNQGLYKSTNSGNNWRKYFDAFDSSLSVTGIVKYANDGDTIYAANNRSVYKIWNELVRSNNSSVVLPEQYFLSQNYPNPFNPLTTINYELPVSGYVRMKVFDILGGEHATLVNEVRSPGRHQIEFNGNDLGSGNYFYTLEIDGTLIDSKRMILLK